MGIEQIDPGQKEPLAAEQIVQMSNIMHVEVKLANKGKLNMHKYTYWTKIMHAQMDLTSDCHVFA